MASDSFDIPCQKKRGRGRPQKGTGPKAEKRRKTEIQMEKCRAAAKYTREKRTSRRNVAISQASTLLARFRQPPTFEEFLQGLREQLFHIQNVFWPFIA